MRIATPMGYSSRPPRRVWPVVLVIGLILGLGGGAFAVAWFGRKHADAPETGSAGSGSAGSGSAGSGSSSLSVAMTPGIDAGSAASAPPAPDAAPAPLVIDAAVAAATPPDAAVAMATPPDAAVAVATPPDAAVVAGKRARLTLDSLPPGASVFGPDGANLGKTPLKVDWPVSDKPVAFEVKLRGYRDKKTEITITANTTTRVDLDRIPQVTRPGTGSGSSKGRDNGNGLERPD